MSAYLFYCSGSQPVAHDPLEGWMTLSQGSPIKISTYQIFTLQLIKVAKLQVQYSNKIIVWLAVITTQGIVLNNRSFRKVKNHCFIGFPEFHPVM